MAAEATGAAEAPNVAHRAAGADSEDSDMGYKGGQHLVRNFYNGGMLKDNVSYNMLS